MEDESEMDLVEIAAKGAAKWLAKLPLGPAKEQIGELIGDSVRFRRMQNLARILERLDRLAESRGLRGGASAGSFSTRWPPLDRQGFPLRRRR